MTLATVTDYDQLIEALRARKNELQMTDATLNELANLGIGHVGKLFGDARVKVLGPVSFGSLLWALALKVQIVEDPEARADLEQHWEKRERPEPTARRLAKLGKTTMRRVFPVVVSELGRRGGKARIATMTPAQLRKHQQHAGRLRWAKQSGKVD